MSYDRIRNRLNDFYFNTLPDMAENVRIRVYGIMDEYDKKHSNENSYRLKAKLYEVISDTVEPVVFDEIPFFFETGALVAFSDGKYCRGANHANGWLYLRNQHLFSDVDPRAMELYKAHAKHELYVQSGIYADMMHVGLPMKKIFSVGLCGVLEELCRAEQECKTDEEADFIACATTGIRALCRIAEKFSAEARSRGLEKLAQTAERVPYNPPETFYEGLCVLAFMRKALGALEGMGFSSFGRVDVLLAHLYEKDVKSGVSYETLLDLVTKFLLIWDCTLDRRKPMENQSEYEMENTLTLGGCDADGNPVFNGVTKLFIEARNNQNILYPKMMLRFSENSPAEYLELISAPLLESKSFSLYVNDDSVIPALIASGVDEKDAFDYAVGGCWDTLMPDVSIHNSGEFFNILKPLEWSIHKREDAMQETELFFESLKEAETFEELYARYLGFVRRMLVQKASIMSRGACQWHLVNPVCTLSALMEPCIPQKRDITDGSSKYNREVVYFCGFAETVDSLIAIKKLCYEQKVCTVKELFEECRNEWKNEVLRQRAVNLPSYGDGSEESSRFVGRFVEDLYKISENLPTSHGGQFRLGSHLYTQVIWWGKVTPAMPNGRRKGDYLSQGLSPSRLQKPVSVFDIFDSLRYTDMRKFAANTSISITLPAGKMDSGRMIEFFGMAARSGVQALQPNCVNIDDLRKAQEAPEDYKHIIVRVCGFSAPFVSLAAHYQEEFINRMISEM